MARNRVKKRRFQGNQHVFNVKRRKCEKKSPQSDNVQDGPVRSDGGESSNATTCQSASARKIRAPKDKHEVNVDEQSTTGFRIIDLKILGLVLSRLPCREMRECLACELSLTEDDSKRMGSASCLLLSCNSCGWSELFYTSQKSGHYFEVNRRMVYGMRSVGCGQSAMSRFCSIMNMPPPVGTKPYGRHTKTLVRAAKDVANSSMKDAAREIHHLNKKKDDEVVKTGVSCDSTWQRRGLGGTWQRRDTFQLGVYDAVAHFNMGAKATTQVLKAVGIDHGTFCTEGVVKSDNLRVKKANYKAAEKNKKRRNFLRGAKKRQKDKHKEKKGETYSAGSF